MIPDDFDDWFRLVECPGVSRSAARALLAAFASPGAVLAASPDQWRAVAGPETAAALAQPDSALLPRLASASAWCRGGPGRHVLTLGDPSYPPLLLQTADPPVLLYVAGRPEVLTTPMVAIVGSRQCTPQGVEHARRFASAFGRADQTVVSGLALGIDAAAHTGALATAAPTVAVVGTGLDIVYPRRHAALAERIEATGAIVSEFPPGTPPLPSNFPQRNRLIAGMSWGTLVVEAAPKSGSLITARLAAECGREVFAIPGSIQSALSRGCHELIRQGAQLVESPEEVLAEQPSAAGRLAAAAAPNIGPDDGPAPDDPLLRALGHDPATLDALGARTGLGAAVLAGKLLELELQGHVARLPGGLYQRVGAG